MEMLAILLCLVVVITPILAILAFTRVQKLGEQLQAARLQELVSRVYALEQRLAGMATATQPALPPQARPPLEVHAPPITTAPSQPPAPKPPARTQTLPLSQVVQAVAAQAGARPPALSQPSRARAGDSDLETMIAGSWFNRVGILALIVSVSWFLKYAFDNNWIGATGRVAIGILLGAAMLPWSQWLLGKGYSYFSEGIAGLGEATLLLSIWAGCRYYPLFSREVGFAGMIVVTAVMAAVALGRNSERIALLSLIGGFLTPVLLSTGKDQQVALFTYLLILGAGLLIIAAQRDWRTLAPISFILTELFFWGWFDTFYRPQKLEVTIAFATLFFLLYVALPVLRIFRLHELDAIGLFVVLFNSFAYLGALYLTLWPDHRWPLTLLVVALSTAHVAVANFVPSEKPGEWSVARQVFAGLALTFATLAIPIRLEGKWITLALAVEGAILVSTGFRSLAPLLRYAGLLLLAISALRVLVIQLPAPTFLLNERFATYLGLIVCMAIALFSAHEHSGNARPEETGVLGIFAVAINVYALIALAQELWDYFGRAESLGIDRGLAQHLALSVLGIAYASVLILVGMKRRSALLRWQSLVLFGVVVVKVFLYDSSYLQRFYRILAFFILGLVLLVISFLYQNKTSRDRAAS